MSKPDTLPRHEAGTDGPWPVIREQPNETVLVRLRGGRSLSLSIEDRAANVVRLPKPTEEIPSTVVQALRARGYSVLEAAPASRDIGVHQS
jgi:hypothetical protein